MEQLSGKVAVITGGASGIGLAMAHRLGAEGMSVAIADVEPETLDVAATGLRDAGIEVHAVHTDVTSQEQVEALAASVMDRYGRVHVVCNNAGVAVFGGVTEMPVEEFAWVVDVNFWGVLFGIRAFLPHLEAQGEGHIVNTASVSGLLTQPGAAAYNVSKFGVLALSEALYYELRMASSPVGVSVVCPGTVRTNIFDSGRNRPAGIAPGAGPITDRALEVMTDLGRLSRRGPDEVAKAVVRAVKADDFYVLTHSGIIPFVKRRHEDIETQRNPSVDQGF